MKRRFIALFLTAVLCVAMCTACSEDTPSTNLSFSDTNLQDMKKLDGKTVTIQGYMSTLSPIDGSFMYLLNLPYQSCPFCIPNTTTLSNTIAIYAPKGSKFTFTDRLIRVSGVLEYSSTAFTDDYQYSYQFRIVDASYTVVDASELSPELTLWQNLASTDVIADVYSMYDFINFICFWGTYTAEFSSGKDYLYYTDLDHFLYSETGSFHYGLADGYFDDMIRRIEEVDSEAFTELVRNIRDAKSFSATVLTAIKNKEYSYVDEYSGTFKDGRKQYRMNDADTYDMKMSLLYQTFADWLANWEV